MSTYKRFEDLKVWKEARDLNYRLFQLLKAKSNNDFGYLKNHIFKTAGSIMDNIAEGFERGGNKELIQFLYISKGSAGELRSQIYRGIDNGLFEKAHENQLLNKIESISSQLSLFINYLKRSNLKGEKFNEPSVKYENEVDEFQFFNL